jgi:hypothetical protein
MKFCVSILWQVFGGLNLVTFVGIFNPIRDNMFYHEKTRTLTATYSAPNPHIQQWDSLGACCWDGPEPQNYRHIGNQVLCQHYRPIPYP